jgi:SAM-dependent methyltransferase
VRPTDGGNISLSGEREGRAPAGREIIASPKPVTAIAHEGSAVALDLPTIRAVKEYYARRAAEYDATSWEAFDAAERETVERFVASLPPGRILDIGCGTGFLTRHLRGNVVGVDQSAEVLKLARARLPDTELVCAEVPPLPFADGAFDLAFSSNVYSHLDTAAARAEFLAEALRVARALVVLEQSWRPGRDREACELRRLRGGSDYRVFKRYLTADELAHELDGVGVLHSAEFVAVRTPR